MITEQQIPQVIAEVNRQIDDARKEGIFLRVVDHHLDEDWLIVTVDVDGEGFRASDHARIMVSIEKRLREQGMDNLLILPAVHDE